MRLSDRLRKLRYDMKLTQDEMARRMDVGLRTYHSYEKGDYDKSRIAPKVLNQIESLKDGWEAKSIADYQKVIKIKEGEINALKLLLQRKDTIIENLSIALRKK